MILLLGCTGFSPTQGSQATSCSATSLYAVDPIEKDGWGGNLVRSPDGQWLFVQAIGRPGIPTMQYGAVDAYRILPDGALVFDGSMMASTPEHDSDFGDVMVALDDQVLVSAERQDIDGLGDAGQIYSFRRSDDGWIGTPIVDDAGCSSRYAGSEIAASETLLVVRERMCDVAGQRHVRVYSRDGDDWIFDAHVGAPDCEAGSCASSFGIQLAAGSDFFAASVTHPVSGGPYPGGVVHIYERVGVTGRWQVVQSIEPSLADTNARFGANILLADDETMFVVADYEFSSVPGKIYRFERDAQRQWAEVRRYDVAHAGSGGQSFGHDLALSPDRGSLLISATRDETPAAPIEGVVYHLDLERGTERVIRPVDAASDWRVLTVEYLSDHVALIGEPFAWYSTIEKAGRVFRVNLDTYVNCHQDLTRDGIVDTADLVQLLTEWGTGTPASDLDCSRAVDFQDVLLLLSVWGECAMPPGS